MSAPKKPSPFRFLLLPLIPVAAVVIGFWSAFRQDSISDFFPTLLHEAWEVLVVGFARNSLWPEAGFCWHDDPSRPEVWRQRFVLRDPVEAREPGWTWQLSDAGEVAREWHRLHPAAKDPA